MRFLRPALSALLIGAAALALEAPACAQTCACPPAEGFASGPVIQAEEPPPPLPVYEQPPIAEPGAIWTPGYWAWNTYDYYWVPGSWAPPPQPGLLWTPGYWAYVGGAYFFHQGYWAPHVGFYGGVNYGYGYNGAGYEGGRWEGNRFAYNTTVNNLGGVRVANVYTQPIAVAPGGRASYNGGPGGVALRPTPEQERLTTEEHVRPTQLQVTQARTASMEAMQFRSANQGRPAIAATQRPGEFKGPGVTSAKAADEIPQKPAPNGVPANRVERPDAGMKPPAGAPNVERRLPNGATFAPAVPAAPQTPNPGGRPAAPASSPLGEKAGRPEPSALPKEARPPEQKAPIGPPKPAVSGKPVQPAPAPRQESRAPQSPRPGPAALPPGGERPGREAPPVGGPKGSPGPAARKPQRPEDRERECGKPGAPPCR